MNGLGMVLGYNAAGEVKATLSYLVVHNPDGTVAGLVDFQRHEDAGGEMLDVVQFNDPSDPIVGAKVWPEWLGSRAHEFKVELVGPPGQKKIAALVHKDSGNRRERATVEDEIDRRIEAAKETGQPADIRDLVGGPEAPLLLYQNGNTKPRPVATRPDLPLVAPPVEPVAGQAMLPGLEEPPVEVVELELPPLTDDPESV